MGRTGQALDGDLVAVWIRGVTGVGLNFDGDEIDRHHHHHHHQQQQQQDYPNKGKNNGNTTNDDDDDDEMEGDEVGYRVLRAKKDMGGAEDAAENAGFVMRVGEGMIMAEGSLDDGSDGSFGAQHHQHHHQVQGVVVATLSRSGREMVASVAAGEVEVDEIDLSSSPSHQDHPEDVDDLALASMTSPADDNSGSVSRGVICVPMDRRLPHMRIQTRHVRRLVGQRFVLRFDHWKPKTAHPTAHIVRILGPMMRTRTEVEAVMVRTSIIITLLFYYHYIIIMIIIIMITTITTFTITFYYYFYYFYSYYLCMRRFTISDYIFLSRLSYFFFLNSISIITEYMYTYIYLHT